AQDNRGKWSHINPYRLEEFKKVIAPYYLRREKEDVYTDLPTINRMFTVITIDDEHLKKVYNKALENLEEVAVRTNYKFFEMIGELMILRRICGMAKVQFASNYADMFLEEHETNHAKLCIGVHHKDVRDSLKYRMGTFRTMTLSGEDSAEKKFHIMKDMERPENRILVMNMLAGGIGMDFHYINYVLILERMWSSADEEQFEFRFYNPDKSIKSVGTDIEYIVAKGTIDEWFYDMVEEKRKIFGETIGTNWDVSKDPGSFRDLVDKTIAGRL
ncbi:MAG: hypothetical protein ACRDFB_05405, partial [Rhabdochlamydiaceae bacterium]